jgi:uncharacterized protein (TIGR03437 family)
MNKPAGSVTSTDALTQVICLDGNVSPAAGCPASSGSTLQWVEHSLAGYNKSATPPSYTYTFNWMPPATNVGPVTLYAAGNAVTGLLVVTGTHTYLSKLQLSPATGNPNAPAIFSGGIVPIYSKATSIEPGSWNSIYGSNLASATAVWDGTFPTTLGNISVLVNNKPAYLYVVSSGQINFQAPDDTQRGTVTVSVTNPAGTGSSTVTLADYGPTFLMLDGTNPEAEIPVASGGAYGNGTYDIAGPVGKFPGISTRPVKVGETVELFGTGFGPTTPSVPAGKVFIPSVLTKTNSNVTVILGGVSMSVPAYLVGAGLYQINVTIPQNVGSGSQPLIAITADGQQTPSNVQLAIQ